MWEFIINHAFVIILVAIISAIMLYIYIKQGSSKKKIALKQEAPKQDVKKVENETTKPETEAIIKKEQIQETQEVITKTNKEENLVLQKTEQPRGERQESLDNFKNERLKTHVLQLKPVVQAVILKK